MKELIARYLKLLVIIVFFSCEGEKGEMGPAGMNSLLNITRELAGSNCSSGGLKIESGIDINNNGSLDTSEVQSTQYICDGSGGADGQNNLIKVIDEPAGSNCSSGGSKIETGLDTNENGTLDITEIQSTKYICNGDSGSGGKGSLINIANEPVGNNCLYGGYKIEVGIDADSNGQLAADEVESISYICIDNLTKANLVSDFFQIIVYGQSLSVAGSFSQPLDFYDAKTFEGGILTNYDPSDINAKNAYFGNALKDLPTNGIETPGKALAKILKELIRDENKLAIEDQYFTPVINAPGTPGMSLDGLADKDGIYYKRLIESVKYGKDFSLAEDKSYNVPILCYIQGESSLDKGNTVTEFYDKLENLFNNLNTDIKDITGQDNDVQFIVYQIASFSHNPGATVGPPLAQLKIAVEKENVHFGCSMYQMEYSDEVHGTSDTYRIMGAMMGVVAKRAIVDKTKMLPITPESWYIQKTEQSDKWLVNMKMNVPVKPLVFDATVNSLYDSVPVNYGFSIKNASGDEIITGVSIKRGDTLNIICSENPEGLELTYAIGGRAAGGNLRDSQGDNLTISCEGVIKRVDNWCPIFIQVI